MIEMRAFNDAGMQEFSAYVGRGPETDEPPPLRLLLSDDYTVPYGDGSIQQRKFASKYELGAEVATALGPTAAIDNALKDNHLWAWLSLALHDATMPKKDGLWFIGARSRHIVERIAGRLQEQSHRHLVKGAVTAVRRFGMHAKVLLGRPDEQSKIEEQIMSRKSEMGLASSKEVIRAVYELYFDDERGGVKRGAKGGGPGSVMRLIDVLGQLDVNYDVYSMKAEILLALLPDNEFAKYKAKATSTS